jgi:hypothetical protein
MRQPSGLNAFVLVREVFYRSFENRRSACMRCALVEDEETAIVAAAERRGMPSVHLFSPTTIC